MKRTIICFVLILSMIAMAGCGSKKEDSKEASKGAVVTVLGDEFELRSTQDLYGIHYKENYVDFYSDAIGNMRTMSYRKGDQFAFEVRVFYDESRSIEESKAIIEVNYGAKEQSKTINGIEYAYYEYDDAEGIKVHHYMTVFDGKVYSIGFFLGDEPGNIEEVFMNNVSFE